MTTWIVIPNWDRFQHYGDYRQPPWIKLYTALLHDDDFQSLSPTDRQALVSLWMLYAMTRRRVRVDTAKISRAIGQRVTKGTLERLNHAGFIGFSASTPLALEVEVDKEPPNPLTGNGQTPARSGRRLREITVGGQRAMTLERVAELDQLAGVHRDDVDLDTAQHDFDDLLVCPVAHCRIVKKTRALLDEHLENVHGQVTT